MGLEMPRATLIRFTTFRDAWPENRDNSDRRRKIELPRTAGFKLFRKQVDSS